MKDEIEEPSEPRARGRLWVVSELYYPEETSTGYYLTKIAEGLVNEFEIKVICGQPNYFRRGTRAPRREIHKDVEIYRVTSTTFDKNVIILRLLNMVTLCVSVFLTGLRRFNAGDKILVVTTPPMLPFAVAAASLFRGCEYTLLIHDNYPELAIAAGTIKDRSMLVTLVGHANRWLYKYASRIIVVGRDMKVLLERKTRGLDIPIDAIPNWAELESVVPAPRSGNALLKELGLLDKFVLLYAGNMGRPNDLETIVEAAKKLRSKSQIHFIFLGSGAKKRWLEDEVMNHKLENVTILEPRPRADQVIFLNACDVALVSMVEGMLGVSMPSRTYNILAAGKPILALTEEGSEISKVIHEEYVGKTVKPNDISGFIVAIEELRDLGDQLAEMGMRARNAAVSKYSLELALSSYRSSLGSIASGNG